jgi:hypothetical protein
MDGGKRPGSTPRLVGDVVVGEERRGDGTRGEATVNSLAAVKCSVCTMTIVIGVQRCL